MQEYRFHDFGIDQLRLEEVEPTEPGPDQVRVAWCAASLNFRDWLVVKGAYNPHLALPAVPLSDGAGVVTAVGPSTREATRRIAVGDRVVSHFISGWVDGPYDGAYLGTTLGTPGPGVAATESNLPIDGVVPIPDSLEFEVAATLPIAALTAWSVLVTEGGLRPDPASSEPSSSPRPTVLLLGTGGVSIFGLQLATALGARVAITSKSRTKLERARAMGAELGVDYVARPDWDRVVRDWTERDGVDIVLEAGGVQTLSTSLRAVRAGGTIGLFGALTGLQGEVDLAPILMKRVRIAGILVDSRRAFEELIGFVVAKNVEPVIDRRYPFSELPRALEDLGKGDHFGKIVIEYD